MIKLKHLLQEQTSILRKGSRGKKVEELQKQLIQLGLLPELQSSGRTSADGIFGSGTKAAVVAFQKNPKNKDDDGKKLKPDGIVGPKTYQALKQSISKSTESPNKSTDKKDQYFTDLDPTRQGKGEITFDKNWTDIIDSTRRVDICKAPEFANKCASFVNALDPSVSTLGDAWTAYGRSQGGKKATYNVMTKMSPSQTKLYDTYYDMNLPNQQSGGGAYVQKLGKLMGSITKGKIPPKNILTPGSHVGIYWPTSRYHQKAFIDSSKIKKYSPFNTHVGLVIAVKDGVPIILHEVDGQGRAEPYTNLFISWVKSDMGYSKFVKSADAYLQKFINWANS
jgi:hypothetical protein